MMGEASTHSSNVSNYQKRRLTLMKKFVPIHIIFSYMSLFVLFTLLLLNETSLASTTPQVSAGTNHRLALKSDGTVWAWGGNTYGQLGDGTTSDKTTPTQVS